MHSQSESAVDQQLLKQLQEWGRELGFSQIGVSDVNLRDAEPGLLAWLEAGFHGTMHYMEAHGLRRARPAELVPGTVRVITAMMDYLPVSAGPDWRAQELRRSADASCGVISVYARGRDYHKVLRQRLQKLADRIQQDMAPLGHRVFCDSAPVLEVELAQRAGLGWRGKHTLLLRRDGGSMGFLGEIYVDRALPLTDPGPAVGHCGSCSACLAACPTGAIVAPYRVDARRCISYLTIEHDGPIPEAWRVAMGNRIYGCDDCQIHCPWNKFARHSPLPDFEVRDGLSDQALLVYWGWSEAEFLRRTEGSPIRRIGHHRWQRNLSVAMGNALRVGSDVAADLVQALAARRAELQDTVPDRVLREHLDWALAQAPEALRVC